MGLRDRIKHALRRTEEHTTTLVCNRCGATVEAPDDVGLMLVAWAIEAGEKGAEPDPDLVALLDHSCRGTPEPSRRDRWDFRAVEPEADGSLVELASVLVQSWERVAEAERAQGGSEPDNT